MARKVPLEIECLRNGTLDCCLVTGEVFSIRNGLPRPFAVHEDKDGYLQFNLRRDRKPPVGKPELDGNRMRYRVRRGVRVNRLVKIKAMAVAKGGRNWRQFVTDLPSGVDVNHIDHDNQNNRADNLEISTELANRSRREMTDAEYAELQAAGF